MIGPDKPTPANTVPQQPDPGFALQAAGLGIWELDPTTRLINWDDQCRRFYGFPTGGPIHYAQTLTAIHADDVSRVNQAVEWAMNPQSEGLLDITYRLVDFADGRQRRVRSTGRCFFSDKHQGLRFAGVLQEVTPTTLDCQQRELAENALNFRSLIEEAPVSTCLFVGRELRIEVVNEVMLGYWGRDKSVVGKTLIEALPELKGQPHLQILDEVFTTGKTYSARNVKAELFVDGQLRTYYFDLIHKPIRNANGEVYAIMDMSTDVTQQVIAQQQLEESEAKFRTLIEEAPVATCLFVGREMRIEIANDKMLGFWGKDHTALGLPLAEGVPELRGQSFLTILDTVFTTGEAYEARDARAELKVGGVLGTFYFDFTYKPLRNAAGEVYAIMDMAVDVTEQVLARQKLEESEARYRSLSVQLEQQVHQRTEELAAMNEELMASNEELLANYDEMAATNDQLNELNHLLSRSNENLQQFAYVASHDLQEPLRKIQSFGALLHDQFADTLGGGIDYLDRMQGAAGRMSTLIQDLLTFSRIATHQETKALVDLNQVVTLVLGDLEMIIAETGASVSVDTLPTVLGDQSQLGQLFQNLINNALKFRRPDVPPQVSIKADVLRNSQLPATARPNRQAKSYYRIDVADNGIGFEQKYVDRIFQVFQRLHGKSKYAGTGIGLAICEKVVANHGGTITATSQPDAGATFSIYLPA
ncbi:PAS domain-containing sensor histidine kinase [Fibrella arboris]|uniref:PAS domain-containing sensor histidine kinase n=1 Tax=Fibrella arboris TaxID=3242486 RepID=UPI0035217899